MSVRKIHHPATSELDLATILKTVGDPVRLEIVGQLREGGEATCSALADRLGMPVSTLSYHLRQLREAGVTKTRAEGTERYMSVRAEDLEERFPGLVSLLESGRPVTAAR
jgi:DNA-binding transcriptional ArsR family regulator